MKSLSPSISRKSSENSALPVTDGKFGFYRASSHDIVELPESGCAIQSDPTNRALKFLHGKAAGMATDSVDQRRP